MKILGIWLLIINAAGYILMGEDKRRALVKARRIPEKALFLAAACFGALGGVLGMQIFRHKTKHWYFNVFFPLLLAAQAALLIWGYTILKP